MIDCPERGLDVMHGGNALWRLPLDHDDLDAERARRGNFSIGRLPAAVFGDDDVDAVFLEERTLLRLVERTRSEDVSAVRCIERRIDGVDAAHEIGMLRRAGELVGFLPADGEKDATAGLPERLHCRLDAVDGMPAIPVLAHPAGAHEHEESYACHACRFDRVGGDPVGEGMRRVDQQVDFFVAQIVCKPRHAAEAAHARRQRQRLGVERTAGKRNSRIDVVARGKPLAKFPRFGRAAENQNAGAYV